VGSLPQGQTPLESSEEVAESVWLSPQDALKLSEAGGLPMMPPTLIALRALAELASWKNFKATYRL
jgi:hypothetical protein